MESQTVQVQAPSATEIIHRHIRPFSSVRYANAEQIATTIEKLALSGENSDQFKRRIQQFLDRIRPDHYRAVLELLSDHRYLDSEIMALCLEFLISRVDKEEATS